MILRTSTLLILTSLLPFFSHDARAAKPNEPSSTNAGLIPVEDFVRHDRLNDLMISPTGTYLAMTVSHDASDGLIILKTSDLSVISANRLVKGDRLVDLFWSSPERIIFSAARSQGRYATSEATENWAAINADGSGFKRMWVARSDMYGSNDSFKTRYFDVLDAPGSDAGTILVNQFIIRDNRPAEEISELDTVSGKISPITRAPKAFCDIALKQKTPLLAFCPKKDAAHKRRRRVGSDNDDDGTDVYRYVARNEWTLIKRYTGSRDRIALTSWSNDGDVYAVHSDGQATTAFGTVDPTTGAFRKIFQDPVSDPDMIMTSNDSVGKAIGIVTQANLPNVTLLADDHPDASLYSSLSGLFPRKLVVPGSATRDGSKFIFRVMQDRSPSEFYLYDREAHQARLLMRRREWLNVDRMAKVKSFVSKTRDGVEVRGYLTIPNGSDGKHLPMIVNVHGGPMGVRDDWTFDAESQLLASRGYLVLRVNFRGSEGYGEAFSEKAYGQWGSGIMHDIIDATKWAIDQGHADRNRICIFGGSFGGYAAMMAPTVEPGLYRCAFGYVGLYDAEIQMKKSDTSKTVQGLEYLERALGATPEARAAISPVNRAHLIKIPVYLAAGKDDERCPPEHTIAMQKALIAAGNPPEGVIIQKDEKHGFEKPENNLRLYTEMLAFFDRHIGAGASTPPPAATGAASTP